MIKEGQTRLMPIGIDYCKNNSLAICGNTIVSISKYNEADQIINFSFNGEEIYANIQKPTGAQPKELKVYSGGWSFKPIRTDLWQYILDNNLQNGSKIEFDDSEEIITSITWFKKPTNLILTTVYKIKMVYFQSYHDDIQQINSYLVEDYSSYENAEKSLPKMANIPSIDIGQNGQYYFTIEKLLKRKEYEKETYKA